MDYQKAYQILFNGITDALEELKRADDDYLAVLRAETILQCAQRQTEDMDMESSF